MKINQKLEKSIITQLKSIIDNNFDENTIKMLLIDIRDLSFKYNIIKEIAHFIAHPERDQGIFQNKINSRWYRTNFITNEFSKLDLSKAEENMSFDEFLWLNRDKSEFEKIHKKIFMPVFQDGLNDFTDDFFHKSFGKSRKEIQNIISSSYKKKEGYYYLKPNCRIKSDFIMRIIQTSVQFGPIFSKSELIKQFIDIINDIKNELSLNNDFESYIRLHADSIYLCILCLLHDVTFKNKDTILGKSFLSVRNEKIDLKCTFYPNNKPFTFILLSSEILLSKFSNEYIENKEYSSDSLKQFTLERIDGKLLLQ